MEFEHKCAWYGVCDVSVGQPCCADSLMSVCDVGDALSAE